MLLKHLYGKCPEILRFLLKWEEIVSLLHEVLSVSLVNVDFTQ